MAKLTEAEQKRIVDLYMQIGSQLEVSKITGHAPVTVCKYIGAAGLGCGIGGNPTRKITDDQIIDAINDGLTRKEIADKYGVHAETLTRRFRQLGVHPKKKASPEISVTHQAWHRTQGAADLVESRFGGEYEYIGTLGDKIRIRCKQCGAITEKYRSSVRRGTVVCENCKKLADGRKALHDVLSAVLEYKTPKYCVCCGGEFYSQFASKKYCSEKCKRSKKKETAGIRRRCRTKGVIYFPGITLKAVYDRDNGVCQICGKPCDWNDHSWTEHFGAMYPTIDHITAIANGGGHTWDNVQLAHAICNSYKRDLVV